MSIQVTIADEPNGRQFSVMLTSEQYERAQRDTEYVQQLVHDFDANMQTQRETEESLLNEPTEQHVDQELPSLFIWNEACILLLLTLYSEHKDHFEKMRHKLVYDIISRKMCDALYNVTGTQCQSKINSMKKHYKKIVDHNATSGNDRATWPYFDRMNELFGSTGWANPVALASELGPTPTSSNENTSPQQTEAKKRKFDYILEDYRKDMKKYREERSKQKQDNFNKYMEMKEQQHREKIQILQSLCNKK